MAYTNFTNLTDWQYDTATKKIKHNTGSTRITVNALYSEVMDEFDNSGQMDDTVADVGAGPRRVHARQWLDVRLGFGR